MNRDLLRQSVNVITAIITLTINVLANALPINGQTSAEISNRLPVLFVPANYVFSIWGVIYALLIGFTIYQALPSNRENSLLRRIGYLFALSNVANASWLLFFHYNQFPLSLVAMLVLLVTLITIYRRIHAHTGSLSRWAAVFVRGTFSVYLGWITVATIANAAYVLVDAGWDGFGIADTAWTVLMLVIAGALTTYILLTERDRAYAAVILWALVGIVIKQSETAPVALAAGVVAVLIVAVAVFSMTRSERTLARQPA